MQATRNSVLCAESTPGSVAMPRIDRLRCYCFEHLKQPIDDTSIATRKAGRMDNIPEAQCVCILCRVKYEDPEKACRTMDSSCWVETR
jgi:hypothetical protein